MDIKVPQLAEGIESATVVNILVSEGERIEKDQIIMELETEKAIGPIPSPESGVVARIHVKEGDVVAVGQLLLSLAEKEEERLEEARLAAEERGSAEASRYEPQGGLPPPASPSVRKIARELGIDLTRIRGREPGGRIVLKDLRDYIQRLQEMAFKPARPAIVRPEPQRIDFTKWGPVRRERLSALRRTVTDRTVASWTTIPHVTQFDEADITALMELRKKYVPLYEKKGARLSLTAIALKALIPPLKKYPVFNASLDEGALEIVYKDYYHIGVAVDTDSGLIVPVMRDVGEKSLLEVCLELHRLSEKARQRKVSLEELQGGSFTLSNLGGIGSAHFTPIIYKPQAAVLGLGHGTLKPRVRNGKVEPRLTLPLCLSYDHRLIDGADAARFVREVVQTLENFPEQELKP